MTHDNVEHRVLDDYQRNMQLIDLMHNPDEIKQKLDSAIVEQVQKQPKSQVGIHFMKFIVSGICKEIEKAQDRPIFKSQVMGVQMQTAFIFDVDGTLTDSRQPMDKEFQNGLQDSKKRILHT